MKEDHGVWKQLTGQCNVDGVVAHSQPFAGRAVLDFHTDGIDGYHEYQQHEYSRYQVYCIGIPNSSATDYLVGVYR